VERQPSPPPYFTLPLPMRPVDDVPRAPATQMYWHQPPIHGMLPSAPQRRGHAMAQIGSHFYIFGGSDGKPPKATNTMYIFDAGMARGSIDTDTSFWRIPDVTGTVPPPLRAHSITPYRHNIYLFGGGTGNDKYYNHVYVFSSQTYRWTCLIESNRNDPSFPTPRRAHTSVVWGAGMYIFGGGSGAAGLNDLWRLDLTSTPLWTHLEPVGRKPEPRVYHTATVVRDVMIIHGGLDGKQCFSNIYLYNFKSNTFTELVVSSGPRLCRISHTTTSVGSQLFVFGGSNGSIFNNELWIFDLTSKTWSMRECAGRVPTARGYHSSVFHDGRLWVFGGMDTKVEGFTDVTTLELGGSGYLGSVWVDHVR
jgi:Rab9 effector protein with kelch motifs